MTPIAIDLDIGNALQAISGIPARRDSARASVWDSLAYHLEAVSFAVGDLDRMYFSILAEIQTSLRNLSHPPSASRPPLLRRLSTGPMEGLPCVSMNGGSNRECSV